MADIEQRVPDAAAASPTDEVPEEPVTLTGKGKAVATPKVTETVKEAAKEVGSSARRKKDEVAAGAAKLDATVRAGGPRLPIHFLTGELRRIVLWEDVVKSSSWLLGLSTTTYFLFFHNGSLLSVAAYALLAATLANLVYVNAYAAYCNFKHQPYEHPNLRTLERGGLVVLNKDWLLERSGQFIDEANRQLSVLSRIVYCEDNLTSFKAAAALYGLAVATSFLSAGSLCTLLLLCVFVLPILYLKFHVHVDRVLESIERQVVKVLNLVTHKAKQTLSHVPFLKIKPE